MPCNTEIMLFVLMPIAWIGLAAFFVALGAMARRGDDALALIEQPVRARTSFGDLVMWEGPPLAAARLCDCSFEHSRSGVGGPADSTRVALRARGVRRAGRCASSRS